MRYGYAPIFLLLVISEHLKPIIAQKIAILWLQFMLSCIQHPDCSDWQHFQEIKWLQWMIFSGIKAFKGQKEWPCLP
jgi:hypothetical protein